jgi:hypothetical protein
MEKNCRRRDWVIEKAGKTWKEVDALAQNRIQ